MENLTLIIPAKNEAESLPKVLEDLKKSLKLDDLKRELLSVPRLSKETKEILGNYSTTDYAYLVKTAKLEDQATLYKNLTKIGLGRKLKVTVGEILKCH